MSTRRDSRHRQRGAAAVEFALVLPLLLTLVLGAIDWGWYFFVDQLVTNAAREGARAGTLTPPTLPAADARTNAITNAAKVSNNYLQKVNLAQTGVVATTDGTSISVTITYPVGSLTGFLPAFVPQSAIATAVMRWQ
jgi:Flp pilus assembly protein TadG